MNHKICIFLTEGFGGGIPTLSYRMGDWLKKRGYDLAYFAANLTNQGNKTMLENEGFQVNVLKKEKWKKVIQDSYGQYEEYLLITYTYQYYYILDELKHQLYKKHGKAVDAYLYAALDYCIARGGAAEGGVKKAAARFCNYWNREYAQALYQGNNLLMMDELVVNTTKNGLQIKMPQVEEKILRLPMILKKPSLKKIKKENIIITVSRMDFPFKGYLMGLLDVFAGLKQKYADLKLVIIGDGKDKEKIMEKIAGIEEKSIEESIILTGNVPYQELDRYFQAAKLFVGMGTGVLDAVNSNLPAIPIQAHTYECRGRSTFDKAPLCVGYGREEGAGLGDISGCIDEILCMQEDEYDTLCEKNWMALKDNYDIDVFMKRFFALKNKSTGKNARWIGRFQYKTVIGLADFLHKVSRDR